MYSVSWYFIVSSFLYVLPPSIFGRPLLLLRETSSLGEGAEVDREIDGGQHNERHGANGNGNASCSNQLHMISIGERPCA